MYVRSLVWKLYTPLNTALTEGLISYSKFSLCAFVLSHLHLCAHACVCVWQQLSLFDNELVFHWTLCRVKGYLCDERPTWGWLDTRPQLFIRPPTVCCVLARIRLCVSVSMCTCQQSEAVLHPCELSHVNDTRLQGILSLFVLLPPQGPPLAPISFHLCSPCQMKLRIPFK